MDESTPRFATGIRFLDMQFGGGIPAGDMVAVTAPPDSQSEVFFKELAREQSLLYASTICDDEAELEEWVEPPGSDGAVEVAVTHLDPERFLASPDEVLGSIPENSCVVVDPIDELETGGRDAYLHGLNLLKERLRDSDSVAFVHCLDGDEVPGRRSLTLKRADHVWRLRQTVDADELSTTLYVPKSRAGETITEAIKVELSDRVDIDTSRNIA